MPVKPLKKNVLVAENSAKEVTSDAGIILDGANSVRESKTATVLAIGSDVLDVQVGDVVLLDWSKGQVVKVDDAQRVMINVDNIVAVLEK